jgi:hypothetical protein
MDDDKGYGDRDCFGSVFLPSLGYASSVAKFPSTDQCWRWHDPGLAHIDDNKLQHK